MVFLRLILAIFEVPGWHPLYLWDFGPDCKVGPSNLHRKWTSGTTLFGNHLEAGFLGFDDMPIAPEKLVTGCLLVVHMAGLAWPDHRMEAKPPLGRAFYPQNGGFGPS